MCRQAGKVFKRKFDDIMKNFLGHRGANQGNAEVLGEAELERLRVELEPRLTELERLRVLTELERLRVLTELERLRVESLMLERERMTAVVEIERLRFERGFYRHQSI
jgi:hypothetical protein